MLAGQRQRTELRNRDSHARRLLLDKRAGTGRTDLVHLEVRDLAVFERDILAVLTADFKYGVRLRHPVRRRTRLCGDFVTDGIRAHHAAHAFTPRAGHADTAHGEIAVFALNLRQSAADNALRVTGRAEILEVDECAVLRHEHEVGAGRANINADERAVLRHDLRAAWLGEVGSLAQCQLWQTDFLCAAHFALCKCRQQRFGCHLLLCALCRANSRRETGVFRHNKFVLLQTENITNRTDNTAVEHHTAAERHRLLNRQILDDGRLVVANHRVAKAEQYVLLGHTLLLTMNNVGLGEYRTSARQVGYLTRLCDQLGIIFNLQSQT